MHVYFHRSYATVYVCICINTRVRVYINFLSLYVHIYIYISRFIEYNFFARIYISIHIVQTIRFIGTHYHSLPRAAIRTSPYLTSSFNVQRRYVPHKFLLFAFSINSFTRVRAYIVQL